MDRIAILSKAFQALEKDKAYQKDFERILNKSAKALVDDEARKVVDVGLKLLFEEYKEDVDYLTDLPQR